MGDFHELQTVESIVHIGKEMTDKEKLAIKLNPLYGTCNLCTFRHHDNCPFNAITEENIHEDEKHFNHYKDVKDKYLYEYQGERCHAFKYKPAQVHKL